MVLVRLFEAPIDEDTSGLGDYEFNALPRPGETVHLNFTDREEILQVERVEHHFFDHSKPAEICLFVKRKRGAKKKPTRRIGTKIGPRPGGGNRSK